MTDWAADPLTATAADQIATGYPTPSPEPWVSEPWQGRLVLIGSEASPIEPGYLEGSIIAAERVAAP